MIVFLGLALIYLSHGAIVPPPIIEPQYLDMLRATGQDEKFAEIMGIDVSLVRSEEDSSEMDSKVSHLGDILLTNEQLEQSRQFINFNRYPGSKWSYNVIPFWISTSDFSSSQRNHIYSAIVTLNNSLSNLSIRQWRSGDQDYIMVISGRGCYANLGRVGGEQTVSIQKNGCMRTGTIQHEFIHAAGCLHEHMRPDRDNYVRVIPENIPDEWKSQYDKASAQDFVNIGKYDYYSVMHYPMQAPGTGRPAFEIFDKSIDESKIGQRDGPTALDISKVDKMYAEKK